MITLEQYFNGKLADDGHKKNAANLITRVNGMLHLAHLDGCYDYWIDEDTGTTISGAKGGSGGGGYRDDKSKTGTPKSTHRFGQGIDIYDPDRVLAQWCVHNQDALDRFGIWAEDFRYTNGWCHLQTKRAKYGRIFIPSMTKPSAEALDGQKPLPDWIR